MATRNVIFTESGKRFQAFRHCLEQLNAIGLCLQSDQNKRLDSSVEFGCHDTLTQVAAHHPFRVFHPFFLLSTYDERS